MTDPTFALSRTDYYHERSYADYLRLIQLSDYDTCFFDEMDTADPTRCYIVSPYDPHWGGWPGAWARIIWYDMEWRTTPFPDVPGVSEVWVADAWYAQYTGKKYVPLGSHPGLKLDIGIHGGKLYDVATLWYMGPTRRQDIIHGYSIDGERVEGLRELNVSIAPQGWNEQRHAALMQSAAMLHVHQHEGVHTVSPQRFALAAAYGLPVITETLDNSGIFGSRLLMSDYRNLPQFVKMWTQRNERRTLEDHGHSLYQLLCIQNNFRSLVEAAL